MSEIEKSEFIQGYVCAVATMTSIIGEHTNIEETLRAGIGNKTAKDLKALGVEQYDIDKLKEVGYL